MPILNKQKGSTRRALSAVHLDLSLTWHNTRAVQHTELDEAQVKHKPHHITSTGDARAAYKGNEVTKPTAKRVTDMHTRFQTSRKH